ncbi:MAG: MltA domain-containing protein, partial [Cyanobacteria bacterium J06639_1]
MTAGSIALALLVGSNRAIAIPLQPVETSTLPAELGRDRRLWFHNGGVGDKDRLSIAIARSLTYLETPAAVEDYAELTLPPGVTRDRVRRSLQRFRQLVLAADSPEALNAAVRSEFRFYRAAGTDGRGTVEFTGYYSPTFAASRERTSEYRYPLYRRPADLETWPLPHPTRADLEGADGLRSDRGPLQGLELVWLRDRLDAFLVQVQGSARLQLTDGKLMTVGYAGRTEYDYTSIGKQLVADGKFTREALSLAKIREYFRDRPQDLDEYLPRNQRFVFFEPTEGAPPIGSLNVPVTEGRSVATDKSLMPPGAPALVHAPLASGRPKVEKPGTAAGVPEISSLAKQDVTGWESRYVLDQDTGGAIRGAGRVDLFIGIGDAAEREAGEIDLS